MLVAICVLVGRPNSTDLSSLRAESARAVTGRRCPHSGVGEDFLVRRPGSPHENGRFSVNPAGTGSVVIVGHFFGGPDGPNKFR